MKKFLSATIGFVMATCANLVIVAAQIQPPVSDNWADLPSIIRSIGQWNVPIASLLFVIGIVYGGYLKLGSPDNQEKQELAIKVWQASIAGFGIIVLAPFIARTVTAILGVEVFT